MHDLVKLNYLAQDNNHENTWKLFNSVVYRVKRDLKRLLIYCSAQSCPVNISHPKDYVQQTVKRRIIARFDKLRQKPLWELVLVTYRKGSAL